MEVPQKMKKTFHIKKDNKKKEMFLQKYIVFII